MTPPQNVCVHVSYVLELNNLAGKQVSGLKGSWGRQLRARKCHSKAQGRGGKPGLSCFYWADFSPRDGERSGSPFIFNLSDRKCLKPGQWMKERNVLQGPWVKVALGLNSQCQPQAPAQAAHSPQLHPHCSICPPPSLFRLSPSPTLPPAIREAGPEGPAGVGKEASRAGPGNLLAHSEGSGDQGALTTGVGRAEECLNCAPPPNKTVAFSTVMAKQKTIGQLICKKPNLLPLRKVV